MAPRSVVAYDGFHFLFTCPANNLSVIPDAETYEREALMEIDEQEFDLRFGAVAQRRAPSSPGSVANQLESLRRERSMTLQALSKATGVAASTLSKIERDELSPTISTLQKITSGLGIEMSDLFTFQSEGDLSHGRRAVSRAGEGRTHQTKSCANVLLCSEIKNKKMVPIYTTVIARSLEDYPTWARSDGEIFLMVISGRMELHSEIYEPLELGPGDSVYYDARSSNAWISVGDTDAEVVWVLTA